MKEKLEALKTKINEVTFLEVGICSYPKDLSYDIILITEFKNKNDLDIYQNHPEHVQVVEFVKEVVCERAVVDYNA